MKLRDAPEAFSDEPLEDTIVAAGLFWARRRPVRAAGGWVLADLIEEADRAAASIDAVPARHSLDQPAVHPEIGRTRPILLGVGRHWVYGFGLSDGDRQPVSMAFVFDLSSSAVGIQVHPLTRRLVLSDRHDGRLIAARGSWWPRSGSGTVIAALRQIVGASISEPPY